MAKKHVALPTSQTSKPRLQKDIFIFLVSRGIIWCHYVDLARAEHLNLSGMATVWKSALKKDTCVTFGGLCICEHLRCLSDNHIFQFLFIFFVRGTNLSQGLDFTHFRRWYDTSQKDPGDLEDWQKALNIQNTNYHLLIYMKMVLNAVFFLTAWTECNILL